jgi:hypothetical protein
MKQTRRKNNVSKMMNQETGVNDLNTYFEAMSKQESAGNEYNSFLPRLPNKSGVFQD